MLRVGTRSSLLARTQSATIAALIAEQLGEPCELVPIRSDGDDVSVRLDAPARPGIFVATLREALLAGAVNVVVHSFKDLPSAPAPGLMIAAVPARGDARDGLLTSTGATLEELPADARVGTSSPRRTAALLRARPDLTVVPIRGNIDSRAAMVEDGRLDAVVLAKAGLDRIGRTVPAASILGLDRMVPAPAQGALAIECREDDPLARRLAALEDPESRCVVTAERAVLVSIEAACTTAVGAYATYADGQLDLRADLFGHRGVDYVERYGAIDLTGAQDLAGAAALGHAVAQALLGGAAR